MIDASEYTHVIVQHQGKKKKNLAARAPKVDSSMIYVVEEEDDDEDYVEAGGKQTKPNKPPHRGRGSALIPFVTTRT